MTTKGSMLEALGATAVLLPSLIGKALAANDAAKYYLTLLQTAARHTEDPDDGVVRLRREREAARVEETSLDLVVEGSSYLNGAYRIPELDRIGVSLGSAIDQMLAPLVAANPDDRTVAAFQARQRRLESAWHNLGEVLDRESLTRLTSGQREDGDSVHLLIMDLHRALNELQSAISTETVAGARVLAVEPAFRPHVSAFMGGLHQTAPLKFEHPGLGTTATQVGDRLVIQNDIGTTDVHLLLVGVQGLIVTVTYSDLHDSRVGFFQHLLSTFPVQWDETIGGKLAAKGGEEDYQLAVGTFAAPTQEDLLRFLRHLGSRLVFLIDWNRARKRLRRFVPNREAIALLEWAADHDHGHMGWLVMGGERLIFDALEASRPSIRIGEELADIIGTDRAGRYLRFVLETCAQGLLRNRPDFLVRDEIRSELASQLRGTRQTLFSLVVDHGTLAVELAMAMRDGLPRALQGDEQAVARLAARGQAWEHDGDRLLNEVRGFAERWPEARQLVDLLGKSDDVLDMLEEGTFLLTLVGTTPVADPLRVAMIELGDVAVTGAREYRKALENGRLVTSGGGRQEMADFAEAIDAVLAAEHSGDQALRRVKRELMARASDFRQLEVLTEVARCLEKATDYLMRVALSLRTLVLAEMKA